MQQTQKPITEWADDDKPREKLLHKGRQALSNAELIAILLRTGTKNESAIDLAKRILQTAQNNLVDLGRIEIKDLLKIKGIGETKALTIAASLELGRRRAGAESQPKTKILSSRDAFTWVAPHLSDLPHETFVCLGLTRSNQPIAVNTVSSGGLTETIVDVRMIFKCALEMNATSLIVAHNHPSGNLNPSDADMAITEKLKEAGKIMNIKIIDHLIIGHNEYMSMVDQGLF